MGPAAVVALSLGVLACEPALAADSLKQTGVVIDRRGVVDPGHWTISETAATWDTPSFTGRYTWSIPSSIPASGANASLSVTSTDKSGGRYNGVIGASADMTIEGTAQAQALADKNGGTATASATAQFRLVPGSHCDTCTPTVTVAVQDGPKVTFQYSVATPPCSVAARFSQAQGNDCKLGKLPVGKKVTVAQPGPGETTNISPTAIPPETYELILEILAEQEGERLAAALTAKVGGAKKAHDAIHGCVLITQSAFEEHEFEREARLTREGQTALFNACARLLLSGMPSTGARPAASGCRATVAPLFKKGSRVTKRRRRQAVAAIRERVRASCRRRPKGIAVTLRARGRRATLNRVTGRRIGAPLARASTTPANGRRATVLWKARRR